MFEYTEEDLPLETLIAFRSTSDEAHISTFPLLLCALEIPKFIFSSTIPSELKVSLFAPST